MGDRAVSDWRAWKYGRAANEEPQNTAMRTRRKRVYVDESVCDGRQEVGTDDGRRT